MTKDLLTEKKRKPYPAYKDSGVEWLAQIPENWEVKRLKRLFRVVNGSTPKSGEPEYWDGDIPWVTPDDLGELPEPELSRPARYITKKGYENCGTTLVPKGSLVLSTRAPIGHLAIAGIPICTNQGCRSLVLRGQQNGRYYYYQLLAARPELESLGDGSTFKELAKESLESTLMLQPSRGEQIAITVFLDRATQKIDALVAKKERLIELLQEKRAALITHAVTKGLPSTSSGQVTHSVPMKDSGVEWLGQIPAHWSVKRLKFSLRSIEQGWSPSCLNRTADLDEWGVLKVGCVNGTEFNPEEHKALPVELSPIPELEVEPGDILMSRANTRELLGSAAVVEAVRPKLLLCDKLYRLKVANQEVDRRFLVLVLGSANSRFQMEREATGASGSMQNIGQETVRNILLPIPPVQEQEAIVGSLAGETAKLDALIAKVREGIEKLKEYRTALISAAVTGKIDVRQAVTTASASG